jgi:hypothetical protein
MPVRLLFLHFLILVRLAGQDPAVKSLALHHSQALTFLEELSDRVGPRLTGSPQDAQAAQWALRTMRALGLQNVHAEPWQLEKGWRRHFARGRLISPFPLELMLASYGWTGSTRGNREAGVVSVDADALAAEAPKNAAAWAGKVLLVTPKDPKRSDALRTLAQLPAFLSRAAEAGAIAVLLRDRRPGALLHTGPIGFPARSTSIAVLDIVEEQEALIARLLNSGVPVRLEMDVSNEFTDAPVSSNNIVGEITGSRHPEQVVLLGAHLDSWDLGTGAIDDGFGVAAVLGAAQSLAASGAKPGRTIRFALFTGEEQGLLGSREYVRAHRDEWQNFVCALILDWGNGPITKFPLAGHAELAAPLEPLFRSIADVAAIQVSMGYLTYTDAYAFTFAGIPAVAPLQDSPNYSAWGHSAADTIDKVNPEVLARDSAILALAAIWIADSPSRIGSLFSPERTARELEPQRATLELLGLWPFSR